MPNFPHYMVDFINDLQVMVVKSLKRKGSCIKRGKLFISLRVENYLIKNFKITKRFTFSNILNKLQIDQEIFKENGQDSSTIKNFKLKFGNKSIVLYKTSLKKSLIIEKSLNVKRVIYYEFIREIEIHGKVKLDRELTERHIVRKSEWISKCNKNI